MTRFGLAAGASSKDVSLPAGARRAQRSVIAHARYIAVVMWISRRARRRTDRATPDRSDGE